MKKHLPVLLAGVAIILILGLAIAPGILGQGVRAATIERSLALFPPESRRQLEITESSYARGWFASEGVLDVQYSPIGLNESITLTIRYEVDHGPLLATDRGLQWGLALVRLYPQFAETEVGATLANLPFTPPRLQLTLVAGFNQSLHLEMEVSPVNYRGTEGELIFAGAHAALVANGDLSADFRFTMERLHASDASGRGFNVGGIELFSHSDRLDDILAPASGRVAITDIISTGAWPLRIATIEASSALSPSPAGLGQIDIHQQLDINGVESEWPVQSLNWTSEINALQGRVIRHYYELLNEFQQQAGSGGAAATPINTLGRELALALLQNPLTFHNRVQAAAYQGTHAARLDIDWDGLPHITAVGDAAMADLVGALILELDITLDLEAVLRSPLADSIDPYVQQGYIVIDNGQIRLEARLRDSELLLNGERVPLEQYIVL